MHCSSLNPGDRASSAIVQSTAGGTITLESPWREREARLDFVLSGDTATEASPAAAHPVAVTR
jgi:hypothetical protein